jgi:hypothetical protein
MGCGRGSLCPVSGVVTLEGQPLTTGFVLYHPDDGQSIPAALLPRGRLDDSGRYELISGERTGAPAGRYRVVVVAQDMTRRAKDSRSEVHPEPLPLIDRKYFSPQLTPLRAEVRAAAPPNAYDQSVTPLVQ